MSEKKSAGKRGLGLGLYCVGNMGYEFLYQFAANYQNFLYTEILKVNLAVTTVIITVVNLFKAIFTPVVGVIIDSDPFKAKNKSNPWIRFAPIFNGAMICLMAFLATKGVNVTAVLVVEVIYNITALFQANGYRSAIPLITSNTNESTFVASGIQLTCNIGRTIVGAAAPLLMIKFSADGAGTDAQGYLGAAVVFFVCTVIVYWIAAAGVDMSIRKDAVRAAGSEAKKVVKEKSEGFFQLMKLVFGDVEILIPFAIGCFMCFRTFLVGPAAPYYFKYVAGSMVPYATFGTLTNIANIAGILLCPIVMLKVKDAKKVCLVTMVLMILCHLAMLVVGEKTMGFILCCTFFQFFYQFTNINLFNLFLGALDNSELKQRKAGKTKFATSTGMSLTWCYVMVAQVLGTIIRNAALGGAGYVGADTVASPELTQGLLNMFCWWPVAFIAVAFVIMCFYKLDAAKLEEVRAELNVLRAASVEEEKAE